MAAQYTEISLSDMETFLKRAFRALRPKQGVHRGEYYYDLSLSDYVTIRVWTSVQRGSQSGAGAGEDAIRIQLMGVKSERPLMKGKAPIVKRTQGWKNSLQGKIEDLLEAYEEKPDYWDNRGGDSSLREPRKEVPPEEVVQEETPPPVRDPSPRVDITEKQIKYLRFLIKTPKANSPAVMDTLNRLHLDWPLLEDDIYRLTKNQASMLISAMAPDSRYAEEIDNSPEYSYDYRR